MDILGIGPLELVFILIIALIVFGPNDMVKAGRTLGRFLRRLLNSDLWREVNRLRNLPNRLIREAGLEEDLEEINKGLNSIRRPPVLDEIGKEINKTKADFSDWTSDAPPADATKAGSDEVKDENTEIEQETEEKTTEQTSAEFPEWTTPQTSSVEEKTD